MNNNQFASALRAAGAILSAALLCTACATADRFDTVKARTWKKPVGPAAFPEMGDPRVSVDYLRDRPSFGIAFSGGGTRSATATLGELRALTMLGWIDRARYVTANSGGSWTTVPYVYLPRELDEQFFLGAYTPPEKIDDSVLHPESGPNKDRGSMSSAIYRSKFYKRLKSLGKGDESYSDAVGDIFLEPFGLSDRTKVFTFHDKALDAALQGNPDLSEDDFYKVTRKRPYPIVIGTMRVPLREDPAEAELYLIESTPLYTGVPGEYRARLSRSPDAQKMLIGGGYVESFGYDSFEPEGTEPNNGRWEVRLKGKLFRGDLPNNKRYRFTLADVIGMSGAAPAITLKQLGIRTGLFPEFRHWAIDRAKVLGDDGLRNRAKEITHGDGGDTDNLALMPLLTRKVENILVFINTARDFPKNADCSHVTTETLTDDLISLFRREDKLPHNVVFEDTGKLETICREFSKRKNLARSAPLVYCDRYRIKDNDLRSVNGDGYRPSICWVYLDRVGDWIAGLDEAGGEITRELRNGTGDFENFPHYRTFAEHKGQLIDTNRQRVHALTNLTAWTLLKSRKYVSTKLAGAALPTDGASED